MTKITFETAARTAKRNPRVLAACTPLSSPLAAQVLHDSIFFCAVFAASYAPLPANDQHHSGGGRKESFVFCVLVNLGVLSWIVIEPHSPIAQALQAL